MTWKATVGLFAYLAFPFAVAVLVWNFLPSTIALVLTTLGLFFLSALWSWSRALKAAMKRKVVSQLSRGPAGGSGGPPP